MGRRSALFLVLGLTLGAAVPAHAAGGDGRLSIELKAGRLADALRLLSVKSGTGLLFNPEIVGERGNPGVVGVMGVEEALHRLLKGSGLVFRRTAAGTILVEATSAQPENLPIPEILVLARKTPNADIRRGENDIQPYQTFSSHDIASAQADNVGQFLRDRLTSDAHGRSPAQDPSLEQGSNRSTFNLHGLGAQETLILIDGARMPGIPSQAAPNQIDQPDLNGVPLFAIERIETLTATSGGIYGPGATGGVINVVLKRDYRGAQLSSSFGLTDRGDAARKRVDARLGFTPDDGRTDVMVIFSRSIVDGLRAGDRDYAQRSRQVRLARDPDDFEQEFPKSAGVLVIGARRAELTLLPSLGGQSLGSYYTFLPTGYRTFASGAETLVNNAGSVVSALSTSSDGSRQSLESDVHTRSVIVGVRHKFGSNVEAFVDLLDFQNDATSFFDTWTRLYSPKGTPGNPFQNDVYLEFPLPGFGDTYQNHIRTSRLTTGLVFALPGAWKAQAGYGLGRVRSKIRQTTIGLDGDYGPAISSGVPPAGKPALDPFGDWATFAAALQSYQEISVQTQKRTQDFQDGNLRLAGPLLRTGAGTASLTMLAERRRENIRPGTFTATGLSIEAEVGIPSLSRTVSSLYGEIRAPIVPRDSTILPLRGLEFQVAARYDHILTKVSDPVDQENSAAPQTVRYNALGTVAGLRVYPLKHVMLRASMATGALPPAPDLLVQTSYLSDVPYADPRRGGTPLGSERPYTYVASGSSHLKPERARTLSFGLVLNPEGGRRPRISLDYRRIDKHDEIYADRQGDVDYILANESRFPDRVVRAPLTAADIAAGYSGGVVTAIDTTALNIGRTKIEAIDLKAEYFIPLRPNATLRLYGAATWQFRLDRRAAPELPTISYVGYSDGPLRWRANAGFDVDYGPMTIGLNGQYYDHYLDVTAQEAADGADLSVRGMRIPGQFYLDLSTRYRVELPTRSMARAVEFSLGIQNLLDHKPPIIASSGLGYSFYGDPRGRRFELTIDAQF